VDRSGRKTPREQERRARRLIASARVALRDRWQSKSEHRAYQIHDQHRRDAGEDLKSRRPHELYDDPQGNAQLAGAVWHSAATSFDNGPAKFIRQRRWDHRYDVHSRSGPVAPLAARVTELATDASEAAAIAQDASKTAIPVDPQRDANFLVKLGNGSRRSRLRPRLTRRPASATTSPRWRVSRQQLGHARPPAHTHIWLPRPVFSNRSGVADVAAITRLACCRTCRLGLA
jgi:hypothetical protein